MTTAQQVIDRAGGYLRIVSAPGAAVDATTSADMLTHLQDLISEWAEQAYVNIPAPSALATTLDVSAGTIRFIALNLAVDYAQAIGKSLDPWLVAEARATMKWREARSTLDREISLAADGMNGVAQGRYNIETDS